MTGLERVLIIFLWIIIGCFICYKRDWYREYESSDAFPQTFIVFVAIVAMPINFMIIFFKMFLIKKWNNE